MVRPASQPPPPLATGPSLTHRTFRAFAWVTAQAVASKGVGFVSQILLAWLLQPADFGLVGMAYTVYAFVNLVQQAGVRDVLVQRQGEFRRWATPGFWMSLALGLLAGAMMAAAAPAAAAFYGQRELVGVVLVLAAAAPLQSLWVVPAARLQIDLRFKALAAINLGYQLLTTLLTLLLAAKGFGAYSFVIPMPIAAVAEAVALWRVSRVRVAPAPRLRRWRYLARDSALLIVSGALITSIAQGDYIVLGLMYDKPTVGLYYFAFVLSMQAIALLVSSSTEVLFPALSRLRDDQSRQGQAFLRASRLMLVVGLPVCLLQAALADPAMRWVFKPQWAPAIPLVQMLSLSSAFRLPMGPSAGIIKAQGRFRTYLWFWVVNAVLFLLFVTAGAWLHAAVGVAAAVLAYSVITGPYSLYVACRTSGGGWGDVVGAYAVPVVGGGAAVGLGLAAGLLAPAGMYWARIAVISVVSVAAYGVVVWRAAPEAWGEVARHFARRTASVNAPAVAGPGSSPTPARTA